MEQSLNYDSYSDADHAGTHRQLAPGPERDTAEIAADFNTLMREGYVIIEGLLSADDCQRIKSEGLALLGHTGRNSFEGVIECLSEGIGCIFSLYFVLSNSWSTRFLDFNLTSAKNCFLTIFTFLIIFISFHMFLLN